SQMRSATTELFSQCQTQSARATGDQNNSSVEIRLAGNDSAQAENDKTGGPGQYECCSDAGCLTRRAPTDGRSDFDVHVSVSFTQPGAAQTQQTAPCRWPRLRR